MFNRLITPIIMAGGSGTRLWPVSREDMPKQFCDLGFGKTLFQKTLERVQNKMLFDKPIVVCSTQHESVVSMLAADEGVELGKIICEPVGRNTAAAIALASEADEKPENSLYLVLASDHEIDNTAQFHADIVASRQIAMEDRRIVLFGIKPSALETGYGYVRSGEKIGTSKCRSILEFIEKPDSERVEILVQEPNVYWNSGMFFFRKDVLRAEIKRHAPEVINQVRLSLSPVSTDSKVVYPDAKTFGETPAISFDYAVMEKTNSAAIKELDVDWSDLGSWNAIWACRNTDDAQNAKSGAVIDTGSNNCLISTDGPVVGTCGLENIVVVANRDAVLVAHKDKVQDVKTIVEELKETHPSAVKSHASETRPWGRFESLDRGSSHQVKRITVNPGGQLSLQYHFHRSEHWVVVRGIATVTVDDDVQELSPCQQVFIPQGAVHRLENFTDEPVEIIEVQYGTYFGEDDIVRVEDIYNRSENEIRAEVA